MSAGEPTISVIVPVLDDLEALGRLLARLRRMTRPPNEILVADGNPGPAAAALCAAHDSLHLASAPGRGRQNHAGAMRAHGDVLWFLHADTEPPLDGCERVARAIAEGAVGGCFRFRFSGPPAAARSLLAGLINWRATLGTPYGDQGLFAARAAYAAAGGFPDQPLFEEVPLVRALRRLGEFRMLPASIGVSPRRWERDGWIARSLGNRALAMGYMLGIPPGTLARRYRPIREDGPR